MGKDRPRVLVTGASGLLGGRLASLLSQRFPVVGGRHLGSLPEGVGSVPLDLLEPLSIEAAIAGSRADAVLHAAALADPDLCERDKDLAHRTNVEAARTLGRLARRSGLRLVSLSTDLVFSGEGGPFAEGDVPGPLLAYGMSKRLGELAVFEEDPGAAVARIALVLGRGHGPKPTSSESVAWSLEKGRGMGLFDDQFRTPVDPESLAAALEVLLAGSQRGLFHLGGPERLSRFDLGTRTAKVLGLDPSPLGVVHARDRTDLAPRPRDVSLDSGRARRELGFRPRPLDVAISESRRLRDPEKDPGGQGRRTTQGRIGS